MEGAPFPPHFEGQPILFAATIFGMLTVWMLAMEWTWRLVWRMIEQPQALRCPVTVYRLILLSMLTGMLIRVTPDVLIIMLWAEVKPETIRWLEYVDRLGDAVSAIPMLFGWFIGIVGGAMVEFQLLRLPVPLHLWPSRQQLRRPLVIGSLVLSISLSVAFLR